MSQQAGNWSGSASQASWGLLSTSEWNVTSDREATVMPHTRTSGFSQSVLLGLKDGKVSFAGSLMALCGL